MQQRQGSSSTNCSPGVQAMLATEAAGRIWQDAEPTCEEGEEEEAELEPAVAEACVWGVAVI